MTDKTPIVVSWPAYRLYKLVMAGNAKPSISETARLLKLEKSVVIDAICELHGVGIVPSEAVTAALREPD